MADAIRTPDPDWGDRIADVGCAADIDFNSHVSAIGGTIASFATSVDHTVIPYWTLGFADTCLRILGSDDFAPQVKAHAAAELTAALVEGTLQSVIAERFPLEQIAAAQERVEAGAGGRVLVQMT